MATGVFLIPNGPKNLAPIFPGLDFSQVKEYYVQVFDNNGTIVATSPINKMACCNNEECVRVHFLNYLGGYDAVDFPIVDITHEDTSSEFQNSLPFPLAKTDTGIERFNVKSNDTYEVSCKCLVAELSWLQECKDSPKAFMEWIGKEGQSDNYIPIVIIADKFKKLKTETEYDYQFSIKFKFSNENSTIRN